MSAASVHSSSPAVVVVLFFCGLAVFALIWIRCFNFAVYKFSGWKKLLEQFPPSDKPEQGSRYGGRTGCLGKGRYRGMFSVEVSPQGLHVTPSFASRQPILIPWFKIRDVSVASEPFGSVSLGIDFEVPTRFDLPTGSLEEIRKQVPPERIHNAVSYFKFAAQKFKVKPNTEA